MIVFLYFFLMLLDGFVLGVLVFIPQFHSVTFLIALTLWYGVALYGIHLYTGRLALWGFRKYGK